MRRDLQWWVFAQAATSLLLLSVFLIGCQKGGHGLVIAGSTSVQPVMEKIAEAYRKQFPDWRVTVEGGGSSAGIMAARMGTAQMGMSSRPLKANNPDENVLIGIPLAYDGIAVIVNRDNPMKSLTLSQLRHLFMGRLRNWQEISSFSREVHLVIREEGSGTRSAFEELVMLEGKTENPVDPYALVQDSTGGVREVVRTDPGAIGFISLGAVTPQIKALEIDGVAPTSEAVKTKEYKLVRPFLLVLKGAPASATQHLIDFALGSEGARLMLQEGLVSAR